jgi:hypothetical protein
MTVLGQKFNSEEALELYACRAGDCTALHIQTRRGRYVFRFKTPVVCEFVSKKTDANGNLWPAPARRSQEEAPPPKPQAKDHSFDDRLEQGWQIFKQDSRRHLSAIERQVGVREGYLSRYFIASHAAEYAALRAQSPRPYTKVSEDLREEIEHAYEEYAAGTATTAALARRLGMKYHTLAGWFMRLRMARKMKDARQPVLKPSGTIL